MKQYLLILLFMPAVSFAKSVITKGAVRAGGNELRYELVEDSASKSQDLIYWFHGSGGSEEETAHVAENLGQVWDAAGFPRPKILGISFGPQWLAVQKNSTAQSGLLEFILSDAIPYLEKHVVKSPVASRSLLGFSMGGFNALQAGSASPRIFDRVALVSAGVVLLSPFATEDQEKAFLKKSDPTDDNKQTLQELTNLLAWAKSIASTPEEWAKIAPLARVKDLAKECDRRLGGKSQAPRVYVSAGIQDHCFFPGNKAIAKKMKDAGLDVEWHKLPGNHGDWDYESLAKFLVRPLGRIKK